MRIGQRGSRLRAGESCASTSIVRCAERRSLSCCASLLALAALRVSTTRQRSSPRSWQAGTPTRAQLKADGAHSASPRHRRSQVIGAYLEAIVATANEIPPLWQISPRLSSNYVAVTEKLLPRLRALVSDVIAQRRKEDLQGGGGVSSDLLSVLVQQEGLSDEDIQYILFDLIIAGSDTTASTLTAALFLLHEVRQVGPITDSFLE